MVKTCPAGRPQSVVSGGREWMVGAEPVRWFERVSWWEAERRMPKGLSRMDVEVWQIQARLGQNRGSSLTTMELIRDGLGRWVATSRGGRRRGVVVRVYGTSGSGEPDRCGNG